jgi:hypothetical protein
LRAPDREGGRVLRPCHLLLSPPLPVKPGHKTLRTRYSLLLFKGEGMRELRIFKIVIIRDYTMPILMQGVIEAHNHSFLVAIQSEIFYIQL